MLYAGCREYQATVKLLPNDSSVMLPNDSSVIGIDKFRAFMVKTHRG
jgi:hypothetical protein